MTKNQLNHVHDYLLDAVDSLLAAAEILRDAEPTARIRVFDSLDDLVKAIRERDNEPFAPQ